MNQELLDSSNHSPNSEDVICPLQANKHKIDRIVAFVARLRPVLPIDIAMAERNIWGEIARLEKHPDEAAILKQDLQTLLSLPHQTAFYAETCIRSALGFWLELIKRIGQRLLPTPPDYGRLIDIMHQVFNQDCDHQWILGVSDENWLELASALGLEEFDKDCSALINVIEAVRALSYRIAGTALDRELLLAEPTLEYFDSPFLAQNAALLPILELARNGEKCPTEEDFREVDVLLDQCIKVLDHTRRKASENGISVRLTYLLAQLHQLIRRQRELLEFIVAEDRVMKSIKLMKILTDAVKTGHHIKVFVGESVSLLSRNITDHASRHGEHYIAGDRAAWWAMARSAAGAGAIIAVMAMLKIQLTTLHLPVLTEAFACSLNYGFGFVLIYLLGFTVATKQPAMTASVIAATLVDARPRDLELLVDLAQNVVRTQFLAVIANVALALPVSFLLAYSWPVLFGSILTTSENAIHLLSGTDPWHSAALFFAAVAGIGLFLSGLVSGYFDNQARYHQLASRIAVSPALKWLGTGTARKFGFYLDAHFGAILGNLFFGFYLGFMGEMDKLTGLPVDIRHVTFSSANLGTALAMLDFSKFTELYIWSVIGVIGIALVNLLVSFSLALYVAMQSKKLGLSAVTELGGLLLQRFLKHPFAFLAPPDKPSKSQ
jgi:site-specific recombinase